MTNKEVWENISKRLTKYAHEHGYTQKDLDAEVTVYHMLMKEADKTLKDAQQEKPLTYCDHCGGEIYDDDYVCQIEGWLVHEDCLTDFIKKKYATPAYRAIDLFNGRWEREFGYD